MTQTSITPMSGPYCIAQVEFISARGHEHTRAVDRPTSQADIDAVNAIQSTPWRVNQWLLDVMRAAYADGLRVGGLEVGEPLSLPASIPDEVWAAMSPDEQKEARRARGDIHRGNRTIMGKSQAVAGLLEEAEELRNEPAIYFPHRHDFRHRTYPMACRGPHPQGSGPGKALIHFAEGRPLGEDGMFWLCVRAANCYGHDKIPLEERVQWVLDHADDIKASALVPLEFRWWADAGDDPWGFLTTCHELNMAWDSDDPADFVSHLPVPLDATCSGLQHLSAMGCDAAGAHATNLTPAPRQDIYIRVAEAVSAFVERDAASEIPEALVWRGRVSRKVCKRAVMTKAYGVTRRGIRTQLLSDGHVPASDIGAGKLADYLTDRILEAMSGTIAGAQAIMEWLQDVAGRLAKAGLPLTWTTPSGSTVRQGYYVEQIHRIHTLLGKSNLASEASGTVLSARKQALAAAPNVIHSYDAAHLTMTVLAGQQKGIIAWAVIHDSFGTHAANTTLLAAHLREAFIEIYRHDQLAELHRQFQASAPQVNVPAPPARGDFNITSVRDSEFFFS